MPSLRLLSSAALAALAVCTPAADAQAQEWGPPPPPPSYDPYWAARPPPPSAPPPGYAYDSTYAPNDRDDGGYDDGYGAPRPDPGRDQNAAVRDQDTPAVRPAPDGSLPIDAPPPPPPEQKAKSGETVAMTSPTLPRRAAEAAAAYVGYVHSGVALSPAFSSGAGVGKAVRAGAAYEPGQFEAGAIAYVATLALRDPVFVAAVRETAGGDGGRTEEIARELVAQPEAVASLPGIDRIAAHATSALHRHGAALIAAGVKIKQSAYDIQRAAWSKANVADPKGLLANAKSLSVTPIDLRKTDGAGLETLTRAEEGKGADEDGGAITPVVGRGLALAALTVLGRAEDEGALEAMLTESSSADCLKMAKLNLFQCLAVAGPHYEDVFCLGEHALKETGQCVVAASGAGASRQFATTSAPSAYWDSQR